MLARFFLFLPLPPEASETLRCRRPPSLVARPSSPESPSARSLATCSAMWLYIIRRCHCFLAREECPSYGRVGKSGY